MREIIAWTIPILVSLFLIQTAADMLQQRALAQRPAKVELPGQRDSIRGPVHEVDRDVMAGNIIT